MRLHRTIFPFGDLHDSSGTDIAVIFVRAVGEGGTQEDLRLLDVDRLKIRISAENKLNSPSFRLEIKVLYAGTR
jgi:hypothetical protein